MSEKRRKPGGAGAGIFCIRLMVYIVGLFVLSLGVAVSVKSALGASPVNCVPYVFSLIFDVSMGTLTTIMYLIFILIQALMLRRDFKPWYLLEIFCSFLFGWFVDVNNFLLSGLPAPEHYLQKLGLLALSVLLIALGVFLYCGTGFVRLPVDGLIDAIAQKSGIRFHNIKILVDSTLTVFSAIVSLIGFHSFVSVREGTVISAITIGFVVGFLTRIFGKGLNRLVRK